MVLLTNSVSRYIDKLCSDASVNSRMSASLYRLALFFYNFSSVLSLKYEKRKYVAQNVVAIFNILKAPCYILLLYLFSITPYLTKAVLLDPFTESVERSKLSKVSSMVVVCIEVISIALLAVLHFCKKESIENLANTCLKKTLSDKYFEKFKKYCKNRSKALLSVFLIIAGLQYFGSFKISIATFLLSLVLFYPIVVLFSFVSFINNFENYIVASLKEFRSELELYSNLLTIYNHEKSFERCVKLLKKYQEIFELVECFNQALGKQVTVFVCQLAISLIFHVRFRTLLSANTLIVKYLSKFLNSFSTRSNM